MRKKPSEPVNMSIRPRPGNPAQGILRFGPVVMRCALGRSGTTVLKCEGDGATPLARMRLVNGYVKSLLHNPRQTKLPLVKVSPAHGWCDAVFDRNYNRPVRLPYAASTESMLRSDRLYDVCIVLDWNIRSRRQRRGSAIFLHIALPGYPPTEGCIAISPRDMARLLPYLNSRSTVQVFR